MELQKIILATDETIIAVNKPAGLLSISDGYNPSLPNLANLLEEEFGRIWVVHRLDKDTSGVMLFARRAEAHRALNIQFQKREIQKVYRALVVGVPSWQAEHINLPLKVNGDRKHRTIVDFSKGKPALTEVQMLETLHGISYLILIPRTGYTHQIRAHLSAYGLPIVNDPLYKSRYPLSQIQDDSLKLISTLPIHRTALHAENIQFSHPTSGETITIQAPEPEDFRNTLQMLSR